MLRLKLLQYFRRCAPDVAEDLAHDTLVAFVANRDNLRDDHALRRYLYCIAKRALIRAPSRQKVQLLSLEECASRDLAEYIDLSQIDVARLLGSQASCSVETLVEYYLGGRPAPEIARARGVEVSTIRNQIRRGLARLRRSVAEASRG